MFLKLMNFYMMSSLIIISLSCSAPLDIEKGKKAMIETDNAFSDLSRKRGANAAFLTYLAEDAVVLQQGSYPVEGKDKIRETIFSAPDTGYILTRKPSFAYVSKSGDLGYTYGIFEVQTTDKEGNPALLKGTYLSIWKKDENGNWKMVLDTGNLGLGEEK